MAPPEADRPIEFRYTFAFEDGSEKKFDVVLDAQTLELRPGIIDPKPEWTKLDYFRCDNCPLTGKAEYCPVALNLATLVKDFKDSISYESTVVTVNTSERTYQKKTPVQKGLSSIIGIYMVTSNCPVMDELRPMTRFHLPFATATETLFRAVSTYLTSQFFVMREGKEPDWELTKLIEIYKQVSVVNKGISQRLAHASEKDANVNAIIILHSFGDVIPFFIENGLDEIGYLFSKFMRGRDA
jgi:Domain of unknown function (DUF6901)